jgi:hypothetical protein
MTRRFALVVCAAAILAMGTATVRAGEFHSKIHLCNLHFPNNFDYC